MDEHDLLPDPLEQFRAWFGDAPGGRESMALATADASGAPSVWTSPPRFARSG